MAEGIRLAVRDDVQAIMALEQGSIAHPWPEEDILRLISDDDKFALVKEGEDGSGRERHTQPCDPRLLQVLRKEY